MQELNNKVCYMTSYSTYIEIKEEFEGLFEGVLSHVYEDVWKVTRTFLWDVCPIVCMSGRRGEG